MRLEIWWSGGKSEGGKAATGEALYVVEETATTIAEEITSIGEGMKDDELCERQTRRGRVIRQRQCIETRRTEASTPRTRHQRKFCGGLYLLDGEQHFCASYRMAPSWRIHPVRDESACVSWRETGADVHSRSSPQDMDGEI